MLADFKRALRSFARTPGFTGIAVLTLALGIGASTAIFSVVNAVVLRPLPFPEPERLIRIFETSPDHAQVAQTSGPNLLEFSARNRSFTELAVVSYRTMQITLLTQGEPEQLSSLAATGSLFRILEVTPVLGRTFTRDEERLGGDNRVVILSHGFWQRRFGSDPAVVGTTLNLGGENRTVIGVLPSTFRFATDPEVWVPFVPDPSTDRGDRWEDLLGRLRPGVSLDQARSDMSTIAGELGQLYPESNAGWGVELLSFPEWIIGPQVTQVALALGLSVGLLLLLACANVSNLLIAQAIARQREMAVRAALGAGRSAIVRQLLTESLALALIGAGAGLFLAFAAAPLIRTLNPDALPRLDEVSVDGNVLLFTLLASLLTAVAFGIAPAIQLLRSDLRGALAGTDPRSAASGNRLRDALVVGELAMAMTLLIGAGLLANSFLRLQAVDPGFEADQVLTVEIALPPASYPERHQAADFYREALERVRAIPGVSSAGASMRNPFRGLNFGNWVADPAAQDEAAYVQVGWDSVTSDYFRTMGIPLLKGRVFQVNETSGRVAIVSAKLAEQIWPGEDPIGKEIQWIPRIDGPISTVVGVVDDVRRSDIQADPRPAYYWSHSQFSWRDMTLMVKTVADTATVAGAVRDAVWAVDETIPVPDMRPLEENLRDALAGPRFSMQSLGIFAAAALLMATTGIYGIISHAVARRTREIGIRMALGARPGNTVRMVFRHGLRLTAIGMGLGVLGALGITRFLESLLYETEPTDVATFVVVALILGTVAVVASYLPARRAAQTDPVIALRRE